MAGGRGRDHFRDGFRDVVLHAVRGWKRMDGCAGITVEDINARGGHVRAFAVAIIGALLSVTTIAILVQLTSADTFIGGLLIGALAAVGLVLAPMATGYIFEGRPLKLYIINAAENSISLIVIALILALWQ